MTLLAPSLDAPAPRPEAPWLLQFSGVPLSAGRSLAMINPAAREVHVGDIIGGEDWMEVASRRIDQDGPVVELVVAPIGTSDLRTHTYDPDQRLAVLRPEPIGGAL